jgi:hypothetical protein
MTTIENDYTVLFVGDYFSLVIDVTMKGRDLESIVSEAIKFVIDYYGWTNIEQVSKQIIVRDTDGEEIGEI